MAEEPPRGSYTIKYVCMYVCKAKKTARKKVNSRLKKMTSRQNKEKHGRKTNLANSLGAGYARYFKAVFCVSCGSL